MGTNIVYDKKTGQVIIYEEDGIWVLPEAWSVRHFEGNVSPVLYQDTDGNVYLSTNSIIFDHSLPDNLDDYYDYLEEEYRNYYGDDEDDFDDYNDYDEGDD
jgi:hypothetical protein